MKVGDLVKYRDRKSTDPPPPGSWGEVGLIISVATDRFREDFKEASIEYMNDDGDFIIARQDDVEVISENG